MKTKRYLISACYAVLMVLISDLTREPEVIFPEIIALLIGGLVSPKQVWVCSGPKLVALMTLSSLFGLCLSAYVPLPLFLKLAVGFLFIAVSLLLTRTTLAPMISACILPILLHTESWIYPLSVLTASAVIALTRWAFEKRGLSAPPDPPEPEISWKQETAAWGKLTLVFLAAALLPSLLGAPYFIAPPLLVTFVEAAYFKPVMQKFSKRLIPFTLFSALLGTACRLLLVEWLGLPSFLAALAVTAALFLVIEKTALLFPPVGAIGFLPLILPAAGLWLYPLEVTAGACVFLLAARVFFPVEGRTRIS